MAVPTMTANSPSAGYIAWGSFNVQFAGGSYAVSAGNTNLTYTAWLYNGGTPSVVSSNVVPTQSSTTDGVPSHWPAAPDLGPDDLLLFVNRSGVPLNIQSTQLVDGDVIVTGTITSAQIAANTIVANNIAANTITAAQIATDTLTANQIAANAITTSELAANAVVADKIAAGAIVTSKLSVGTLGGNSILNANFEDIDSGGALVSWRNNFLGGTATVGNSTSTFIDGARSGLVSPTASLSGDLTCAAFPVVPGQTFYVSALAAVGTANVQVGLSVTFGATQAYTTGSLVAGTPTVQNVSITRLDTGAAITPNASTTSAGRANFIGASGTALAAINVIHQISGQVVVPTGATWASVSLLGVGAVAGNVFWDDAECDQVIISAVIGNGQITANNISAGAITAGKLSVGSITGIGLIPNGAFEDSDTTNTPVGWTAGSLGANGSYGWDTVSPISGTRSAKLSTGSASSSYIYQNVPIPVRVGETLSFWTSFKSNLNNATVDVDFYFGTLGGANLITNTATVPAAPTGITYKTSTGTTVSGGIATSTPAGGQAVVTATTQTSGTIYLLKGQVVVPTGATHMIMQITLNSNATAFSVWVDDTGLSRPIEISQLSSTAIDGMTITGALIRTAASGMRWELSGTSFDSLKSYTGDAAEFAVGGLALSVIGVGTNRRPEMTLNTPSFTDGTTNHGAPGLLFDGGSVDGTSHISSLTLYSNRFDTAQPYVTLGSGAGIAIVSAPGTTFTGSVTTDTDFIVGTKSISRGAINTTWRASGAAAANPTTTETAYYSNIYSTTLVSGRRYRMHVRGRVTSSATSAAATGTIRVRLGNGLAGAIILATAVIQTSTTAVEFSGVTEFLAGTDVTAGTTAFTISGQAATGTITPVYNVGVWYSNHTLWLEDMGV